MKKILLILVLAVMSSNVMAEYNEWAKSKFRAIYLGNGVHVDVGYIVVDIDNHYKCDHLTDLLEYSRCKNRRTKYKEDLRSPGPIHKNVQSLYESKIEKILGLKVIERNQVREDTLHFKVKISVRQGRRFKDITMVEREGFYGINSEVILTEGATSFTGEVGAYGSYLHFSLAGGSVKDEASIEGEIYKTIDENIGDIKKFLEEANEFCIKEKCTIEKARERAKECQNKNIHCK